LWSLYDINAARAAIPAVSPALWSLYDINAAHAHESATRPALMSSPTVPARPQPSGLPSMLPLT